MENYSTANPKQWSWSFTGGGLMRGSNWKALNGNVLMVWIGGRLWEVVANGGSTVLKTQLLMKYVTCSQGSVSQYVKFMEGHFYIKIYDELNLGIGLEIF